MGDEKSAKQVGAARLRCLAFGRHMASSGGEGVGVGGARGQGLELGGDGVSEGANVRVEITKQQHATVGGGWERTPLHARARLLFLGEARPQTAQLFQPRLGVPPPASHTPALTPFWRSGATPHSPTLSAVPRRTPLHVYLRSPPFFGSGTAPNSPTLSACSIPIYSVSYWRSIFQSSKSHGALSPGLAFALSGNSSAFRNTN